MLSSRRGHGAIAACASGLRFWMSGALGLLALAALALCGLTTGGQAQSARIRRQAVHLRSGFLEERQSQAAARSRRHRDRYVGRRLPDRASARDAAVGFRHHTGCAGQAGRDHRRARHGQENTGGAARARSATSRPTSPTWRCRIIITIIPPTPMRLPARPGSSSGRSAPPCSRIRRPPTRSTRT